MTDDQKILEMLRVVHSENMTTLSFLCGLYDKDTVETYIQPCIEGYNTLVSEIMSNIPDKSIDDLTKIPKYTS